MFRVKLLWAVVIQFSALLVVVNAEGDDVTADEPSPSPTMIPTLSPTVAEIPAAGTIHPGLVYAIFIGGCILLYALSEVIARFNFQGALLQSTKDISYRRVSGSME